MAKITRAALLAKIATLFADNTTGGVDEGDLRAISTDLADSALWNDEGVTQSTDPVLVIAAGQSNSVGSNTGGPNPANVGVKVWDPNASDWGSSDYLTGPLGQVAPSGNGGNSHIGLSLAHRFNDESNRATYLVHDATGGQAIDQWIGTGVTSARYAALKAKVEAALASPEWSGVTSPEIYFVWAQGEADYLSDFETYLADLQTLVAQLRAETWFPDTTPILIAEMTELHDRYGPAEAIRYLGGYGDPWVMSVNSWGLKTEFTETGSGDNTHWLADSLWEAGYYRMYRAAQMAPHTFKILPNIFRSRLGEPPKATDDILVTTFSSLISKNADQSDVSNDSITWGFEVTNSGNYSAAFGYQTVIQSGALYCFASGRDVTMSGLSDWSFGAGYQVTVNARYCFATGRGHTVEDEGQAALGKFSEYAVAEADPVVFQVGIGSSTSNRKNALTARASGILEAKNLPVYADETAAGVGGLSGGDIYRTATGELRIKL